MSLLNNNIMLLGSENKVTFYNYRQFKKVGKISCSYPLVKIYINKNKLFIGESEEIDYKNKEKIPKCRIIEFSFDENGNYKQIYIFYKPQKIIKDFTQVKDGRLITCSYENIKIWS